MPDDSGGRPGTTPARVVGDLGASYTGWSASELLEGAVELTVYLLDLLCGLY